MPHINTEPVQHNQSVTGFVFRRVGDKYLALLHMHRKLGTLMPVGGHVELNESPWSAIAHELREESGYSLGELQVFQPVARLRQVSEIFMQPQPFLVNVHTHGNDHYHNDLDYAFFAQTEPANLPYEGESEDIRWLTLDEIRLLPSDIVYHNIREILEYLMEDLIVNPAWELVNTDIYRLDRP